MTPEQKARQQIDRQLEQAGWIVQDYAQMHITAGLGVAVREFPLKTGFADYLLYAHAKAIGSVEAKPEGFGLMGVAEQSTKYSIGLPKSLPNWEVPLPFAYESTGTECRFTNRKEPDARSRLVFTFHRPEELIHLVNLDKQVRGRLQEMPELNTGNLWKVQIDSIRNLEKSLALNKPRALIQMATGSGKTFTAVNFCYRLIKYADAKRILFLVDRNNLGKQTLNEFQQFVSPVNGYKFTEEYSVQHLKKNTIAPASKVCITTIQRLYSMLKGEDDFQEENEEGSLFETENSLFKEPLPVVYNPKIPIEMFDFIVVDECHRSIYNIWRQVLEYFDASLIGLTATPTKQTIGFFGSNLVQDYAHEQAVVDGVNVGYDVYRIETKITKDGAMLAREPGVFVPHRDRRTKGKKYKELDDDLTYTANQLDRDVVSENQIRLVVRTFKDKLPEIFPGRTEVPKTLVFAKTDLHAEDIVRILREDFGKGNDFCQKITSKSTGKKPDELLSEFRNSYFPRIAVTVDMIATGTDVKPLECLIFMRNIRSLGYFEQMKGRGCRVVDPDVLQSVTPDAKHKTHFVIVDAVGVCEDEKSATKPMDRKPSVPLDKILNLVAAGAAGDDIVSTLASRLSRLDKEVDPLQQAAIQKASGGKTLAELSAGLLKSIDPDVNTELAVDKFNVPEGPNGEPPEPTEPQVVEVEREQMATALKAFHDPKLREAILAAKRSLEQVIDEQTPDQLLRAGFDAEALEKAKSMLTSFRKFIEDNKDQIEALQVLYSQPYRAGLKFRHVKELASKLNQPPFFVDPNRPESLTRLWQAYEVVEPDKVRGKGGRQLVDVIALVRHAMDPNTPLAPVGMTVQERYQQWMSEKQTSGVMFTADQRKWLDAIKDHIAASLNIEQDDLEEVPFNSIGGLGRAYELFGDKLNAILDELNERLAA
ncbi:MAG: DEAD/DEAH box helicase family protein [Planctomycetota bacterium]|nr:DEAD/DEAH box helicase family protein [Planctomycetota bacterium]